MFLQNMSIGTRNFPNIRAQHLFVFKRTIILNDKIDYHLSLQPGCFSRKRQYFVLNHTKITELRDEHIFLTLLKAFLINAQPPSFPRHPLQLTREQPS